MLKETFIQYLERNDPINYKWILNQMSEIGFDCDDDGGDSGDRLFCKEYPLPAVNDVLEWWNDGSWDMYGVYEECRKSNRPALRKIIHQFMVKTVKDHNRYLLLKYHMITDPSELKKYKDNFKIKKSLHCQKLKDQIDWLDSEISSLKKYIDHFNSHSDNVLTSCNQLTATRNRLKLLLHDVKNNTCYHSRAHSKRSLYYTGDITYNNIGILNKPSLDVYNYRMRDSIAVEPNFN